MGVTGLWRLIEPAGKPVPVETLENKILAVDISIWLHQMVKGYQDAKGAPLPNAHLMGLFQRLCKLLYFRIKPVFVFDGGFPDLKKETIAKRQDNKSKYNSQSEKLKREIALILGKKTAISALLGKQISPKKNKQTDNNDDLFKLPALPEKEAETESEFESESEDEQSTSASSIDLHTVDLESDKFKNLPLKEKYDLLVELKETRKMNSWGKMHTLPKKSDNFSDFQMQRLLKRRKLQECLEETEKEMGDGCMSLNELESLLNEEGIDTNVDSLPSRRIASDNTTRYLLINNVKQALEDAKKREMEAKQKESIEKTDVGNSTNEIKKSPKHDELEDDLQKAIKMSLECVDDPDASACTSRADDSWTSYLTDTEYSEDDDGFEQSDMSSAKAYIMQYSDFTHKAIDSLVTSKHNNKHKQKESDVNKIIEELNQEKTIIEDNIELTSSDDDENNEKKVSALKIINIKSENKVLDESRSQMIILNENVCNKNEINVNDTEASIICIENAGNEIISLDTSIEDALESNTIISKLETPKSVTEASAKESSSSGDEFEEVSDSDQPKKPFIELTLNMGNKVDNDIFADIFDVEDNKDTTLNIEKTVFLINDQAEASTNSNNNKKDGDKAVDAKLNEKLEHNTKIEYKKEISTFTTTENIKNIENKNDAPSSETSLKECDNNKTKEDNITIQNKSITLKEKIDENDKKSKISEKNPISRETLNTIVSELEVQEEGLFQEKGRLDRIGRNITEQMTKEAQELLQVFGIPYIIAPMEAEAQCAFLESVKLTDGTITDDSDIWLFGGRTVYKNFFNQKKHVLQFLSERIERSFNLTREQLVLLALLVGSDYTTGVQGVGPVTALEILASFPFNKKKINMEMTKSSNKQALYQELVIGLQEFKKWVRAGRRTDNINLKKKLKNVSLTDDFPSVRVVQAYLEPNIERSEEKFTWGEIDITILRDYTKSKFGWSQNKLDEIIKPVLKRMVDRKSQKSVYDYYKRKVEFQSLEDQMSKRVKAAVQKMGPEMPLDKTNETEVVKITKKRTTQTKTQTNDSKAGPSNSKRSKNQELKEIDHIVKSSAVKSIESTLDIKIPKSDRVQEIIPQREKDKQHLLENKLKAIEVFRKTKIDRKKKTTKRKLPVPKDKADLSESDSD